MEELLVWKNLSHLPALVHIGPWIQICNIVNAVTSQNEGALNILMGIDHPLSTVVITGRLSRDKWSCGDFRMNLNAGDYIHCPNEKFFPIWCFPSILKSTSILTTKLANNDSRNYLYLISGFLYHCQILLMFFIYFCRIPYWVARRRFRSICYPQFHLQSQSVLQFHLFGWSVSSGSFLIRRSEWI